MGPDALPLFGYNYRRPSGRSWACPRCPAGSALHAPIKLRRGLPQGLSRTRSLISPPPPELNYPELPISHPADRGEAETPPRIFSPCLAPLGASEAGLPTILMQPCLGPSGRGGRRSRGRRQEGQAGAPGLSPRIWAFHCRGMLAASQTAFQQKLQLTLKFPMIGKDGAEGHKGDSE